MVEGAPNSGQSSSATADYGFFIQVSVLLGYTNNAYLANNYVTNHWGVALNGATDGSSGFCLQGMGLTGINIPFAQKVCDNAWSWRNSRGLAAQWSYRENDADAVNTYDAMQLVRGMLFVPPAAPPTLPVTAVDVV